MWPNPVSWAARALLPERPSTGLVWVLRCGYNFLPYGCMMHGIPEGDLNAAPTLWGGQGTTPPELSKAGIIQNQYYT